MSLFNTVKYTVINHDINTLNQQIIFSLWYVQIYPINLHYRYYYLITFSFVISFFFFFRLRFLFKIWSNWLVVSHTISYIRYYSVYYYVWNLAKCKVQIIFVDNNKRQDNAWIKNTKIIWIVIRNQIMKKFQIL